MKSQTGTNSGLDDYEFNTTTYRIVCGDCGEPPQLQALDKNHGTVTGCECTTLDSIPYELGQGDLPDSWTVTEEGI